MTYSQDVITTLKDFYDKADLNYYIDKAQKNMFRERDSMKVWWYSEYPQMFDKLEPLPVNLKQTKTVPMLAINFKDTENFKYENNIYNYIIIDSVRVFTFACVNEKNKVFAFANFFGGKYANFNIKRDNSLKNVIKGIYKHKPELILYCTSMEGFLDSNGFMFIKDNKIYVYRVSERDVFELNEYIRKFFSLDRIRELNLEFIPAIYQCDKVDVRKAGHSPKGQINICSSDSFH